MKKIIFVIVIILLISGCNKVNNVKESDNNMNIKIIVNDKEFDAVLYDNNTSKELYDLLPLELDMNELHGNEKYYYFENKFSTNDSNVKSINNGDIMLFGNNCLVLFYDSFNTSYSYTKLGYVVDINGYKEALGSNDISVKIEKK